jgi:hypothetical protein
MMTLLDVLSWLEGTSLAVLIQESRYGFPVVVGMHILGLTLSVGTLLWVDLRMLGLALQRLPLSQVYRGLAPWFLIGFAVMIASGLTLFATYATLAYGNFYFRLKMIALVLAGLNALVFHFMTQRTSAGWDAAPRPPAAARVAGLTSIVLWVAVMLAGRMMSYTMFSAPPGP